ncbi:MAG: hypothetical protein CVT92_10275 [Bacteroidetes bacterium HGW-Bacteroidetes-1]|jgi:hypothetical protein|nr:MAG: hypothetical protein CVT92_10275 [Bacteroidetes bacterium HGW-Bacteroidetes-1]
MINKILQILALLVFCAACSANQKGSIQLVQGGKSDYTIIIPEQASAEEVRAAEFLQLHVDKISGCSLSINSTDRPSTSPAIYISKTDEIAEGDSYRLFTSENNLFIQGGKNRGCIYGVSELLEHYLGVSYYSPTHVVIPQSQKIILPDLDISDSSPNTYRNINGHFAQDANYRDFHRLHLISDMFAEGYFVHTFHKLIPWQEYFSSKPEYFAYMSGKRIIDQLCLTNEDVFWLTVEKLEKEMKLQPEKLFWSVSQDDNFSHCRCANCLQIIEEEGTAAGPIIHFVNRVAANFPDKVISTLAYQYSRQAPAKTKPIDNVQIMLCTIELNRSQPIDRDARSISFLKDLENWGRISNHIFLWDYTVNFNHHISPFPNLQTLQPNIQLFVGNQVKEHYQQSNTGVGHAFSELKSYLIAKLLWNPDADAQAITNEFLEGHYGPAATWIRKYMDQMQHEILTSGEWLDIYEPPTNHHHTFLSVANMKAYNHYFDEATQTVADLPPFELHVRTARMALQYAMMEIGKADMFGPRGWYRDEGGDFVLNQLMLQTLEQFYQTGMEADAAFVNESGLTIEQYYQSTKRFIDVQVKGNLAFRKPVIAQPLPTDKYSAGDLALLTNGVRGANDFKVHWLGWEALDFSLVLDLGSLADGHTIEISTLYDPKSWILHPKSVSCLVSMNGIHYELIEVQTLEGDQRHEEVSKLFSFNPGNKKYRFVKFEIVGTKQLFDWHPSAGGGSWVFVDETVVR